ncbi:MAG TPA: 2-oxo acid dehydrogenase subunit E2, partial [Nocardioides sp.]|nr:2-oxo acid dehydrogenase subunit E2 [Nocardioides sp.]
MALTDKFEDLGPNSGLVEEMYRQFLENPGSVSASWRDFFADYAPRGIAIAPVAPAPVTPATPAAPAPAPAAPKPAPAQADGTTAPVIDGEVPAPLRGAAARTVQNMEASLQVPTATSVRTVAAKLLEVNRQILNNHLNRVGRGKVSFTHLIAYAITKAVARMPVMNSGFGLADGKPVVVHHDHLNLGIAV